MKKRHVIIVGGGASGMVAAISAAREGAKVTIIEHQNKLGKKILSTGNGKCNLTNEYMAGNVSAVKIFDCRYCVKEIWL